MKTHWLMGRSEPPHEFVPSFASGIKLLGESKSVSNTSAIRSHEDIQKSHASIKTFMSQPMPSTDDETEGANQTGFVPMCPMGNIFRQERSDAESKTCAVS